MENRLLILRARAVWFGLVWFRVNRSNTYIALTYKGPLGYLKYGVYDPYGKQTNFSKPYMLELFDLAKDEYDARGA